MIKQPHRGVTAAWNTGAQHACGEIMVFLNNDVRSDGPWIAKLLERLEEPDVMIVGPCLRTERLLPKSLAEKYPRRVLEGWCFGVRREDFLRLEGFDERFEMYFSDTDLQWRLLDLNERGCLEAVNDLPLVHAGHATTRAYAGRRIALVSDHRKFIEKWSDR